MSVPYVSITATGRSTIPVRSYTCSLIRWHLAGLKQRHRVRFRFINHRNGSNATRGALSSVNEGVGKEEPSQDGQGRRGEATRKANDLL